MRRAQLREVVSACRTAFGHNTWRQTGLELLEGVLLHRAVSTNVFRIGPMRQLVSLRRLLKVAGRSAGNMAQTVKLNNGYEFPVLGLGTFKVCSEFLLSGFGV
jgi:hypothetical protein